MTYRSNFEVLCGKPVDGIPHFCDGCPLQPLGEYNPQKFLAVVQGMESWGPFLADHPNEIYGDGREAAKSIIQEDGEFKDRIVAELAVSAIERQITGTCKERTGE